MVQHELTFPIWVQQITVDDKPQFRLRPLFVPFPLVTDQRYRSGLTQLKTEVKNVLKYPKLKRTNSSLLQWFLFAPDTTLEKITLQFKIGKLFIDGPFHVVRFTLKDLRILCLPSCENMLLIETGTSSADRRQQLTEAVQAFMKNEMEKVEDISPQHYYAGKREFLTEATVKVPLQFESTKHERQENLPLFAQLLPADDFQGAYEINKVAQDLSELFPDDLHRAYHREQEYKKLQQLFFHPPYTPLVLVGAEGVGRHTLIHEVVFQYIQQKQETEKPNSSIWLLDPTRIIAGMSIVGMWQKRFEAILQYLIEPEAGRSEPHYLVIDNPIALLRIGASANNRLTLSDVLKPYLERRKLPIIMIASSQEWAVFQEKDRSLAELFQVYRLNEPDQLTAIQMILKKRKWLEERHQLSINIAAIQQLLYIHRNYLSQKALPGAVIRRMERLAIKNQEGFIDADEVRSDFQLSSGLQPRIFDPAYTFDPDEVRTAMRGSLIGQPAAVEALAQVIHLYKAKLNDPEKPISSLLFIGPTGVGKTQAAKVLANYLLGGEKHLLRFDMNEFVDGAAAQRLLGDYHQPEGQLTGKVRYQPFSIILLDEIEKAHPNVRDLLLQVLDDGRLTDSLGRTVDFTNSIIIMTSNLGAEAIGRTIQLSGSALQDNAIYQQEMEKHFRPEFINRIDQTVVFRKLERSDIQGIARLQIRELLRRDGFVRRTTILNIDQKALQWVADRGYDARMGGRALRRQIEQDLTFLSAEQLLGFQHEGPIIMNIVLEHNHLRPNIHPLEFAEARKTSFLDHIPDSDNGNIFYRKLGQAIEQLRVKVNAYEADLPYHFEKDWRYYQFKTQLDVVKQEIQTIRIAYSDRYYREALATPLRLKQTRIPSWREEDKSASDRGSMKAKLFQEAALQELSDVYKFAPIQFDNLRSEFIDNYLNVALLCFFGDGFLTNEVHTCTLKIDSLIADQGQAEITYLLRNYIQLFEHLDLSFTVDDDQNKITAEWYNLGNLLAGEVGIHLFYVAHANPIPLRITLEGQPKLDTYRVIRVYDGLKTLSDLRTALTNAVNMTPQEFKLLLYGGLPDAVRQKWLGA